MLFVEEYEKEILKCWSNVDGLSAWTPLVVTPWSTLFMYQNCLTPKKKPQVYMHISIHTHTHIFF